MGLLKEDILHVESDLQHMHGDLEHLERDIAAHDTCPSYHDLKHHIKDLHEHVHDLLAHVGHVEIEHIKQKYREIPAVIIKALYWRKLIFCLYFFIADNSAKIPVSTKNNEYIKTILDLHYS